MYALHSTAAEMLIVLYAINCVSGSCLKFYRFWQFDIMLWSVLDNHAFTKQIISKFNIKIKIQRKRMTVY